MFGSCISLLGNIHLLAIAVELSPLIPKGIFALRTAERLLIALLYECVATSMTRTPQFSSDLSLLVFYVSLFFLTYQLASLLTQSFSIFAYACISMKTRHKTLGGVVLLVHEVATLVRPRIKERCIIVPIGNYFGFITLNGFFLVVNVSITPAKVQTKNHLCKSPRK